jgi:Flp pilus assembly protein TadG
MSFTRLVHDRSGAIAPLFALTLVAIVGITGAAVDYSGAASLRTRLQKATDGADLLLCRSSDQQSKEQLNNTRGPYL